MSETVGIVDRLNKLAEQVGKVDQASLQGVAFIALPSGEVIETVLSGTMTTSEQFLRHIVGLLSLEIDKAKREPSNYPPRR